MPITPITISHPALASQWHPTLNGKLTPEKVSRGSDKKIWWVGTQCGHNWLATVSSQIAGNKCAICYGRQIMLGVNDLASQNTKVASQWHPTLNSELTPEKVTCGSNKKVWWLGECHHEWHAPVCSRTGKNAKGCPICAGKQVLQGFNDLTTISPELASQWHPTLNGNRKPTQIHAGANKNVWWLGKCGHEWEARLSSRMKDGNNCPICSSRFTLTGFNDLVTKRPKIASQWHPTLNGNLDPKTVSYANSRKVWWLGECEHEWEAVVYSRTTANNSCPKCHPKTSKAETEIINFLKSLTTLNIEQSNRTVLEGFEIDIWVPEKRLAIEFNGLYWHTENRGKDKFYHYNKWLKCKNQGIHLIQIWEDDWNNKPGLIKNILADRIGTSTQAETLKIQTKIVTLKKSQAKKFLNQNHLQGHTRSTYYLGLYEKSNIRKLVAMIALNKETNNTFKITRYATNKNMIDGFTKLLNHVEKTFKPNKITITINNDINNYNLYENNGFVEQEKLAPDYMYLIKNERKNKLKYGIKKIQEDPTFLWKENLTAQELAELNNLPRIWDAGKTRWVKEYMHP